MFREPSLGQRVANVVGHWVAGPEAVDPDGSWRSWWTRRLGRMRRLPKPEGTLASAPAPMAGWAAR